MAADEAQAATRMRLCPDAAAHSAAYWRAAE
jgi:hypothetical protein